jgi:hypothetical protein
MSAEESAKNMSMKILKNFVLLLFTSLPLLSQSQTKIQPDCSVTLQPQSATALSAQFDNRPQSSATGVPCSEWILIASATTANVSFTITVQKAQDNGVANCVGCSWSTFASMTLSAEGIITATKMVGDYIRINLSAISGGTVSASLMGWRADQATTSSGGGSGGVCPGGSATDVQVSDGTNCVGFADFVWNEVATGTGMTGLQIGLPEPDLSCCDGPSNSMASISGSFIQENYVAAGTGQFIETDKYAATGTPDSPGDIAPPRVPFNNSFWMHTSGDYNIVAYETIGTLSSGDGVWNWGVYPGPMGSVYTFTESTLGTGELSFKNNLGSVFGFSPLSSSGETELNSGVPVSSGGSLAQLDLATIFQPGIAFASLSGTLTSAGMQIYCTDCTVTSAINDTCATAGSGAQAENIAGTIRCRI